MNTASRVALYSSDNSLSSFSEMQTSALSQRLIQFMNALPTAGNIVEWIYGFREALQQLLGPGSVHRIMMNINFNYGNPNDPAKADLVYVVSYALNGESPIEMFSYATTMKEYVEKKTEQILKQMKKANFPFDEYQPPLFFNYYDHNYLGSILLFRYRSPQPIPDSVVEIMEGLHSFIFFALSGAVARKAYTDRSKTVFTGIWNEECMALDLSEKEKHVFILELLAHPRTEIARRLNISRHSINKYVQNINRKAGTNHLIEIIVRQLAPDFEEKVVTEITKSRRAAEGRKKKGDIIQWLHEEDSHGTESSIFIF